MKRHYDTRCHNSEPAVIRPVLVGQRARHAGLYRSNRRADRRLAECDDADQDEMQSDFGGSMRLTPRLSEA